jgi:hypothetical protein
MSGGDSAAARVCCRSGSYPASSSLLPARATADRVTNPSLVRGRAGRYVACISPMNLAHPQGDVEPVVSGPQRWVCQLTRASECGIGFSEYLPLSPRHSPGELAQPPGATNSCGGIVSAPAQLLPGGEPVPKSDNQRTSWRTSQVSPDHGPLAGTSTS